MAKRTNLIWKGRGSKLTSVAALVTFRGTRYEVKKILRSNGREEIIYSELTPAGICQLKLASVPAALYWKRDLVARCSLG